MRCNNNENYLLEIRHLKVSFIIAHNSKRVKLPTFEFSRSSILVSHFRKNHARAYLNLLDRIPSILRVFRSSKGGETSLALGVSHFQSDEGRERRTCRASREGRESETKDLDGGERERTRRPSSWS